MTTHLIYALLQYCKALFRQNCKGIFTAVVSCIYHERCVCDLIYLVGLYVCLAQIGLYFSPIEAQWLLYISPGLTLQTSPFFLCTYYVSYNKQGLCPSTVLTDWKQTNSLSGWNWSFIQWNPSLTEPGYNIITVPTSYLPAAKKPQSFAGSF